MPGLTTLRLFQTAHTLVFYCNLRRCLLWLRLCMLWGQSNLCIFIKFGMSLLKNSAVLEKNSHWWWKMRQVSKNYRVFHNVRGHYLLKRLFNSEQYCWFDKHKSNSKRYICKPDSWFVPNMGKIGVGSMLNFHFLIYAEKRNNSDDQGRIHFTKFFSRALFFCSDKASLQGVGTLFFL